MTGESPLPVDAGEIATFVRTLFRYADEDSFVSLRAFDQFSASAPPVLIWGVQVSDTLDYVIELATRAATRSAETPTPSVFAPPIATFHDRHHARTVDLANGIALSVEIDDDPATAQATLEAVLGRATVVVESGSSWTNPATGELIPKRHLHWRLSEPTRESADHVRLVAARRFAQQLVGADPTGTPAVHPLRWPGSWNTKATPRLCRIVELREDVEIHLLEALERLEDAVAAVCGPEAAKDAGQPSGEPLNAAAAQVTDAMAHIPNAGTKVHYGDWIRIGYAAWRSFENPADGFAAWNAWSRKSVKYDAGETEAAWRRIGAAISGTNPARRISARTIFFEARKHGWKPMNGNSASSDGDAMPQGFTDESLALDFATVHASHLRYVATWGRWQEFDGAVWQSDETLRTVDLARAVCRRASANCDNEKVAAIVASAKTVAAVERLAKADRRHAARVEQWDADPWLLNTREGVVDLRTGVTHAHRAEDYMTKITAIGPGGECPLWLAFLARITAGDIELQAFLQRVAGYALTGSIREHALFFCYGTGANGKGVYLNTLTGIMGSYAAVASIETFTASQSDRHPTDLAMLRGARMVTAQETEEGRRWAESRIKAMTGGDPMTARFMRQDFFTYFPAFKLIIAGNHKPGLRNIDEAIRRRFNLIPFAVRIPPAERDLNLPEKLKAEWPGILAWAIQGCLEWQRIGLAAPPAVINATKDYLDAEDSLSRWIEECCDQMAHFHVSTTTLFGSWKTWADEAGEFVGSQKRFTQMLEQRGFASKRMGGTGKAGTTGLNLKPDLRAQWKASEAA